MEAVRLVYHPFFAQAPGVTARIDGGEYNPILGHSYAEIAGLSRSMHNSQGMGAAQPKGPSVRYFVTVEGPPARTTFSRASTPPGSRLPGGAPVGRILAGAQAAFDPHHPEKTIPALLQARPLIAAIHDPWAARKLTELDETMALCAGLWLDASAAAWDATPGSTVDVRLTAMNRSPFPLSLARVDLEGAGPATSVDAAGAALPYNDAFTRQVSRALSAGEPYSQPYWLVKPHGDAYQVDNQQLIGDAENPPVLRARFVVNAGGQRLELVRPVRYRWVDRVLGERSRALAIVPPVTVNLPQDVVLFPSAARRKIQVAVGAVGKAAGTSGSISPRAGPPRPPPAPSGWSERRAPGLEFELTPPAARRRSRRHA